MFVTTIGSIHFIPGIYPYGMSLLNPIHFRVSSLIFGPLVAKYLAVNGVSGTFWKKLMVQFISCLAFTLMGWVSRPLYIFVILASFSALWCKIEIFIGYFWMRWVVIRAGVYCPHLWAQLVFTWSSHWYGQSSWCSVVAFWARTFKLHLHICFTTKGGFLAFYNLLHVTQHLVDILLSSQILDPGVPNCDQTGETIWVFPCKGCPNRDRPKLRLCNICVLQYMFIANESSGKTMFTLYMLIRVRSGSDRCQSQGICYLDTNHVSESNLLPEISWCRAFAINSLAGYLNTITEYVLSVWAQHKFNRFGWTN